MKNSVICEICGKIISSLSGLTKHLKHVHKFSTNDVTDYAVKYIVDPPKCNKDGCENLVEVKKIKNLTIQYGKTCSKHIHKSHRRIRCVVCGGEYSMQTIHKHLVGDHNLNERGINGLFI
jgi:ribosomal protein S27E